MAIIKVDTPQCIKKVEIAGDTPTQEEQQLILNTFFPETQGVRRQAGEIDLDRRTPILKLQVMWTSEQGKSRNITDVSSTAT